MLFWASLLEDEVASENKEESLELKNNRIELLVANGSDAIPVIRRAAN